MQTSVDVDQPRIHFEPSSERCRLLVAAPDEDRGRLMASIASRLPHWELAEADCVELARFTLQMNPFDVLLLDAGLARNAGVLDCFTEFGPVSIALLADDDLDFVLAAHERGVAHWLPRAQALRHPALLAAVLRRAARARATHRRVDETEEALADARVRLQRLVNRLWEMVPLEAGATWFTQRHMLERLEEEVARVDRHGGALTIALGELLPADANAQTADTLASWAVEQVNRSKRRCDVAGQYGPHGFMLVLPRTAEPAATECCRRLQTVLEQPAEGLRGPRRVCFGVAGLEPETKTTVTRLLRQAEERLEEAKENAAR